jgi:coenzyme Q-binding protein COQ10
VKRNWRRAQSDHRAAMPQHSEVRILPYTPEQIFALVRDVRAYPQFLPWCQGTRIYHEQGDVFTADVLIGYKMIREKYTSRVHCEHPRRITVEYLSGPFHHLRNTWEFVPLAGNACEVRFFIDFEFRSALLRRVASAVFFEVVRRMVSAFEVRAHVLYGAGVHSCS